MVCVDSWRYITGSSRSRGRIVRYFAPTSFHVKDSSPAPLCGTERLLFVTLSQSHFRPLSSKVTMSKTEYCRGVHAWIRPQRRWRYRWARQIDGWVRSGWRAHGRRLQKRSLRSTTSRMILISVRPSLRHRFQTIAHMHLFADLRNVCANRGDPNTQLVGNLFVDET